MYDIFLKLIKQRKITPYKVSQDTGITQATLSRWKTGRVSPSIETLSILGGYFNVSVDFLLGKEKPVVTQMADPSEEEIKLALFGGDGEVTDEMWQEAKNFALFIQQREKNKKK